ncbi:hypothetical protein EV360DRAFT_37804 [Lentinula raphanica]|nr:hypothetical protein EV360DRAFT_37804 [Lentinula raphanica]
MSSPIYTAFLSSTTIFSLPLELAEEILISCALAGSVEAIASFSQTCRLYHELIYGGADNHLWRGIYLATFDDPRPRLRTLRRPISDAVAEEVAFDWKTEYQLQIRAGKLFRGSIVDSRFLYSTLNALSSTALPPHFPGDSFPRESSNIAWLDNVLSRGFPSTLVHRLTLSKSDISKLAQQDIMHPDWERSAAGRAFYKLFFLTGLHVNATSEHRDEEERYHLRSKTREIQQSSLTEAKQRAMARTVARHRVYNLPYLSAERCWGPFLPIGYSPPPPDDELDSHTDDENDTEQDHIVGSFFFTDQDAEDGEDPVISARGSFPVFPQRPDLVYPDWAFLSAARLVITENLRERYGNDIPMWPWFTTVAAVQATREILLRMGSRSPIEALRMGSAPGFWAGRGTKEGWTGIASDEQERELSKPWKIDKDVEFVDGWDWAGAEGRWMRAVCWMDYRDLLCMTSFFSIQYSRLPDLSLNSSQCMLFPISSPEPSQ